ncbi:hypothetical protein FZC83_02415 [Rossellomorea marisflavi]|uniref:Uncharacterized protein n=1 Tax=Rossellomorea marisflavi TaxID=189381 RepID=A0A5D4S2R7_9BACI|nr:hypothetical protein [Rossellomorea marisflavi]TYS56448.1 hypothetical protein FZC83_02415 [Rossellomorea marisflavi]
MNSVAAIKINVFGAREIKCDDMELAINNAQVTYHDLNFISAKLVLMDSKGKPYKIDVWDFDVTLMGLLDKDGIEYRIQED